MNLGFGGWGFLVCCLMWLVFSVLNEWGVIWDYWFVKGGNLWIMIWLRRVLLIWMRFFVSFMKSIRSVKVSLMFCIKSRILCWRMRLRLSGLRFISLFLKIRWRWWFELKLVELKEWGVVWFNCFVRVFCEVVFEFSNDSEEYNVWFGGCFWCV